MAKSVAVIYLARSESGSSADFVRFAKSYRQFDAGTPHDLIVIHKGAKIYDGALARLENAGGAKKKIITFVPASVTGDQATAFPDNWQSQYGSTSRASDGKFTLSVPGERVVAVSQEVLSTGPVADITIEDVPLEDVIAELFAAQS